MIIEENISLKSKFNNEIVNSFLSKSPKYPYSIIRSKDKNIGIQEFSKYDFKYEYAICEIKMFLEDLIKEMGLNNLEYYTDNSFGFSPTFNIHIPRNISSNEINKYWDDIFDEVIKFTEVKNIEYILDDLSIILSR